MQCALCAVCCSLRVVCCVLIDVSFCVMYAVCVGGCLLFGALTIVRCLLFVVCWLSFVVCCLLIVGCGLFPDGC